MSHPAHDPMIPEQCAEEIRHGGACAHGPAYPKSRRIVVLVVDDTAAAEDLQTVLHAAVQPPWKPVPPGENVATYTQQRWGQEETDAYILECLKRAAPRITWQSNTIIEREVDHG